MSVKLEKAQTDYEKLLRDLGEKAEMVGFYEKADAATVQAYLDARDTLSDRQVELQFVCGEITRIEQERAARKAQLKQQIAEAKGSIDLTEKKLDVKKGKADPLRKKISGAEYDMHYVENKLVEEGKRVKAAKDREEFDKVRGHEENIKRMKIDVMKRHKLVADLKRQLSEIENPVKGLGETMEKTEDQLSQLEEELEALVNLDGTDQDELVELRRQREEKEKELRIGEAHVLDSLADIGENLYNKRIRHPVLDKYYIDLDGVARVIDALQQEPSKKEHPKK
jgi:chromosome segregation ATPase